MANFFLNSFVHTTSHRTPPSSEAAYGQDGRGSPIQKNFTQSARLARQTHINTGAVLDDSDLTPHLADVVE